MDQSGTTISNLLINQSSAPDIMHMLDILRSSNQGTPLSPLNGIKRKRALHEIYDGVVGNTTAIAPISNDCSPRSTSPAVHTPSKKFRREEVVPTQGTTSKVLPSTIGMTTYSPQDVLSGRGGGTNQHEGNCFFRSLINENRENYLRAKKNDKPFISLSIVSAIRQRNGRFLKKDEKRGLWFEIGDAAAREKTSQALRQRAPEYRRQMFEKECEAIRQQQQQSVSVSSPMRTSSDASTNSAVSNLGSLIAPVSPYSSSTCNSKTSTSANADDAMLHIYSSSLRQAQLRQQVQEEALLLEQENAEKVLRLEQKLRTIKILELMTLMGNGVL